VEAFGLLRGLADAAAFPCWSWEWDVNGLVTMPLFNAWRTRTWRMWILIIRLRMPSWVEVLLLSHPLLGKRIGMVEGYGE
jgi:hypothetical protein